MNKLVRKNKKGFTLTEMIVVIAIIGILAAVMIPSVVVYVKKAQENAAYQQATAAYDVYEVYLTEKEAGLTESDFADYYQEITGEALPTGAGYNNQSTDVTTDDTFTFVADNGITVIIDITSMTATYEK